ncbi:MAG: hypothetical protein BAA04_01150 [Firmicutes bacterium ZCTH02-B6]|nr:MAG: hypothetical protein BAA04_01150 [Firmicutes bacterium ZCTH02-B6]
MAADRVLSVAASPFLEERDEVEAAYLFGSMARGQWTRSSDIDVGVLFKPGLDEEGRVLARIDIVQSLQERA